MISGRTRVFGLLGHPVRHSLSPAMYNELFRRFGLDALYVAFDVDPARSHTLGASIRTLDLVGVNLTVPFKERIVPQLDRLTVAAEEAGSVNVVIQVEGHLTGYNTDGEGLVRSLAALGGMEFQGLVVFVLGAGGTARAVSSALMDRGASRVTILNRTLKHGHSAVDALSGRYRHSVLSADQLNSVAFAHHAQAAGLVVNCTSAGAESIIEAFDSSVLPSTAVWVDANYWMKHPPQLQRCADLGLRFATGHGMLAHQGALAFELFTGHPVEAAEIESILEVA